MRTSAPRLLPIFRSKLQGELLALVLLNPDAEHSLTGIASVIRADVATVQREVDRLEQAGILTSRRIGRTRLVSPDTTSPLHEPLTRLVLLTFGPVHVLAGEFATIHRIQSLHIFGSWAARHEGRPGPPPADIDVLVIGNPDRDDVHAATLRAEHRLARQVNTTILSPQAWEAASDGFVKQLRQAPLVAVALAPRSEVHLR